MRRPAWSRSLRFGLALRWSLALTVIAGVALVALNVALAAAVGDPPTARTYQAVEKTRDADGQATYRTLELGEVEAVQAATNAHTLDMLQLYSGYALAGLFGAGLLVGWVLAGRALRPVQQMALEARRVSARDLSHRLAGQLPPGRDDELAGLARSIDEMLARLDDAFGRQRRFVDDASHELRTPLAVIRANVEAVLSRPDVDPAARDEAVATTRRAVDRMATLVDDLLASARASAPDELQGTVRLDELAGDEAADLTMLADERDVRILLRTEPVAVMGHEVALRRALDNLLANAVRLTPEHSTVELAVTERDGWASVRVTDAGPGLSEADADRVFDRFWRADGSARTGQGAGQHSGLGLSIVRQVAESHGGVARVRSRLGVGSTFELVLPTPRQDLDAAAIPPG